MHNHKFNISFTGNRKIYFTISAVLIAVSILSTFVFGAKLDIQFKGGTIITYIYDGDIDESNFEKTAEDALGGLDVNITTGKDFSTGKNNIQVSLVSNSGLTSDKQYELTSALEEKFSANSIKIVESSDISPTSGKEFFQKCLVAVAFSSLLLVIYIAIRFKNIGGWLAGACAIVALIHDCIIVYGTFVVCHMSINANFIAVVLTILGYSINDTIITYDRIRENQQLFKKTKSRSEIVNLSINQTLTRSINTSITTVTAMIVVTIVAIIFGVDSIISFSLPMVFGMISGVYSSVCIASPLWDALETIKDKKAAAKPKSGKKI